MDVKIRFPSRFYKYQPILTRYIFYSILNISYGATNPFHCILFGEVSNLDSRCILNEEVESKIRTK